MSAAVTDHLCEVSNAAALHGRGPCGALGEVPSSVLGTEPCPIYTAGCPMRDRTRKLSSKFCHPFCAGHFRFVRGSVDLRFEAHSAVSEVEFHPLLPVTESEGLADPECTCETPGTQLLGKPCRAAQADRGPCRPARPRVAAEAHAARTPGCPPLQARGVLPCSCSAWVGVSVSVLQRALVTAEAFSRDWA